MQIAIAIAGSSSYSTLVNVYLVSFAYRDRVPAPDHALGNPNVTSVFANVKGQARLNARIGYYGICAKTDASIWICDKDVNVLTAQLGGENDPLNLISISSGFRENVVFPGLQ